MPSAGGGGEHNLIDVAHWKEAETWPWTKFTPIEMACRGTGRIVVTHGFMDRLMELRTKLGKPMHVTSGCRTTEHNNDIGGKERSFHICDDPLDRQQRGCLAVDVAATDGPYRGQLFAIAYNHGWTVGWNARRGFLHLDRRVDVGWMQTTFDY